MVRRPAAFLMDEPLGSLDSKFREKMRVELKRLQSRLGATLVYVTHDQLEAMSMGDRIAVMHNGVLQQVGSPREIYERPANLFVARFIGSPGMNLCTGTLRREDGVLRVTHGGQAWPLPMPLAAYLESVSGNDGRIVLGIRPENLLHRPAGQGLLKGGVTGLEPMGPYNLVTLDCGGESVRLRVDRSRKVLYGDEFHFDPAPGTLQLFHAESGQAMGSEAV
jgi:multiple sugar transport system ATP-binding protein